MRPLQGPRLSGDDSTFWHGRARHARCSATAATASACGRRAPSALAGLRAASHHGSDEQMFGAKQQVPHEGQCY